MKKMLLVLGIMVLGVTAARADVVISVGRAFTFACGGAGVYCDVAPLPPPPPPPRGDGVVVIVGGGGAPHRAAPTPRGRVVRHDAAPRGGGKGGAPHGGRR